jgi:integral membrane protein
MAHGILFISYFVFSLLASHKQDWSLIVWLLVLIASVVPFAFIAVEMFVKRASGKIQQVA